MTASLTSPTTTQSSTTQATTTQATTTQAPTRNTLAHGNTPSSPAPFTTTRPAVGLPSSRTSRRTAHTHHPARDARTDILEAASCLVDDGGFTSATTRHIAELTGLPSGAVTAQFGSLDALHATVFQRIATRELAAVEHAVRAVDDGDDLTTDRLTALVTAFATRALQGRRTAEALMYEPAGTRVNQERLTWRRQYHALVVRIIADGVASGDLPAQNPATTARAVTGTVVESLLGNLSPLVPVAGDGTDGRDPSPLVDEVTDLVLRLTGAHC